MNNDTVISTGYRIVKFTVNNENYYKVYYGRLKTPNDFQLLEDRKKLEEFLEKANAVEVDNFGFFSNEKGFDKKRSIFRTEKEAKQAIINSIEHQTHNNKEPHVLLSFYYETETLGFDSYINKINYVDKSKDALKQLYIQTIKEVSYYYDQSFILDMRERGV